MTSEPTDRVRSLYQEAIARPPEERARLVAERARDDVELRASVERLLAQNSTEMAELRARGPLGPGSMLGVYRLEARIGAGGMGEVFRAVDTRLDRKVAIKVSPTRFDERFEREARVLSALNHPHICTLHDVGSNYLVMELIEGATLDSRIARGRLPLADAAGVGAEIADALAEAHRVGIVHRDLKPQNVMLTRHGVKVLDFGIAKVATDDGLTRTGAIIGTAAYLAPEQLAGEPATERSDLYALGVVLYETVTGSRPAPGAGVPKTFPKHATTIARSMGREAAAARAFDELVGSLLAPEPARRPSSAADAAARLRAIAAPLRAAPSRRAAMAVAVAVTIAALGAGGLWLRDLAAPARPPASVSRAKPRVAILPFENLSPDPSNAFFTDGLHEEILATLANDAPDLEVISRTTMESYKGKPVTVEQLAKDLACNYVLEGTVRREGDDVRLTLQLVDAKTDGNVWAQKYDRKLVSAMTLQSEVAGQVAAQLSVKLASARTVAARTNDPRAYDFYLKARLARESLNGDQPVANWLNVAELATRAIEIDPSFVLPYVERFGAYFYLHMQYPDADGGRGRLAQADLGALRRLAPNDALVLGAEAQWAFAEQDFTRASELFVQAKAAGLSDVNLLIWDVTLHEYVGDVNRALADLDRVLALDPGNVSALFIAGLNLAAAHRPADALKHFDVLLAKVPDAVLSQIQRPFLEYETTGNDAAREEINRLKGPTLSLETDHFVTFRWPEGYAQLRDRLDRELPREINFGLFVYLPVFGDTRVPVEWLRGQLDRQLGDATAATRDGQAIVAYVARQTESKWNRWFLHYLTAEGRSLQGDKTGALKAAHEALALSPDGGSGVWPVAPFLAATVLAGAGAEDEAVTVLEKIAFSTPGVLPAEILRTAELDAPLANNARYRALKEKLEARMAENRKLFSAPGL